MKATRAGRARSPHKEVGTANGGRTKTVPSRASQGGQALLKTILVPTDLSNQSLAAMRYAIQLAKEFGATLRFVHVFEALAIVEGLESYAMVRSNERMVGRVGERLRWLAKQEAGNVVTVETEVRIGKPYREIVAAAIEHKVDLIVIATHGYTGLKHAFLGSTAERVVRHAPCPVLVVRDKRGSSPRRLRARRRKALL